MRDLHVRLHPALDRFAEAHWYLHQMERHYHAADPFRWSVNAFLRALKEVPQQIQMAVQVDRAVLDWYRERSEALREEPLVSHLFKARDFVVHQGMLIPSSNAHIGITEGRGMKLGLGFSLHPLEDSDAGMARYMEIARERGDFLGILTPDEDSLPCVERIWRIDALPDQELADLAASAWVTVGTLLSETNERAGHERLNLALDCRHSPQQIRFKLYDRDELRGRFGNPAPIARRPRSGCS